MVLGTWTERRAREKNLRRTEGNPPRRNGQLSDLRDLGIDFYQGFSCREQKVVGNTLGYIEFGETLIQRLWNLVHLPLG